MKIVSISSRDPKVVMEQEQKSAMIDVLEYMKKQVEEGIIKEFVSTSIDQDGVCQIHVAAMDLPGGIGLFEIGKHMLISQDTYIDD